MRISILFLAIAALAVKTAAQEDRYVKDLEFAVAEIGTAAQHLIAQKEIDWSKIGKDFIAAAEATKTDADHWLLLQRLLARLEDGHASVSPLEPAKEVKWPGPEFSGTGLLLARTKKGFHIRGCFKTAQEIGLKSGWEVLKINGKKTEDWLAERVATWRDIASFSTQQHAEFFALQRGMVDQPGEAWEIEVKTERGKRDTKTLVVAAGVRQIPEGPVAYPGEDGQVAVSKAGNVRWANTKRGNFYIHVRRSPGTVVDELDEALAAMPDGLKGLILDYRNNTGGGFDHEAFLGRFIPEGHQLQFNKKYEGAGPKRYGGNIVVIVDGTTVSAGETGAGMFKEDGRAYMIGESSTAGMSSQKTSFDLPSGLFSIRVSTYSNMGRFNAGKGIEGIGVTPHEVVLLDPKDLKDEVDSLIERAEELLKRFPKKSVPYQPKHFDWKD